MNNNPNQPREFDAVLGGKAPPPINGVVLGGLEGVKHRLKSSDIEVQIATLSEALNYGKVGLDIVIETLQRSQGEMQHLVARLLREKGGQEGKQFLLNYDPWLFFTTLEDWNKDELYSKYIASKSGSSVGVVKTKQQLQNLLQKPKLDFLTALVCEMTNDYDNEQSLGFRYCVNALVNAYQHLPNLKALSIGDVEDLEQRSDGYSYLYIGNISPILKAFPNLELLHLCGCLGKANKPLLEDQQSQKQEILQIRKRDGSSIVREKTKHAQLKTLIIEGSDLTDNHITQLCKLEYPSLEYLELWLARKDTNKVVESLIPILSGESCPNLLYLGLIGSNNTNAIVTAIAKSAIIKRLKVLDLGSGNLSNAGVITLLNCPAVNNLHTLNVSENRLEPDMIEQLSQLKCQVIADSQFRDRYNPTYE